ncbi:GILT-like protein 1 isoform X1 [Lepeophtheirus salmonis]|uniref:GILT-like protein 1 isoform X1 n=1 Tax=Lepeophtheirus salmonis TaxID=72036 RepID=UPI001AE1ADCD|nr:GILT-like protein 1 isoform X1 [Lepeophtheirus salmonis]
MQNFVNIAVCAIVLMSVSQISSFNIYQNSHNKKFQWDNIPKVEVSAYYEVLCPDSIRFVRNELQTTYSKLSSIMNFHLIPYGKASSFAKSEGGYEFNCQHGQEECFGNMVHACSIKYVQSKSVLLDFVACMIKDNRDAIKIGKSCAKEYSVDWQPIERCAHSIEGENLLYEEGEKTHNLSPRLRFVPTVELDKSQSNQRSLLHDLAIQVCKHYTGPLPSVCTELNH